MYKIPRNAKDTPPIQLKIQQFISQYDNIECNISFIERTIGVYLNIIISSLQRLLFTLAFDFSSTFNSCPWYIRFLSSHIYLQLDFLILPPFLIPPLVLDTFLLPISFTSLFGFAPTLSFRHWFLASHNHPSKLVLTASTISFI